MDETNKATRSMIVDQRALFVPVYVSTEETTSAMLYGYFRCPHPQKQIQTVVHVNHVIPLTHSAQKNKDLMISLCCIQRHISRLSGSRANE